MCGCINAHMHTHKTKYLVIIHTHIGMHTETRFSDYNG